MSKDVMRSTGSIRRTGPSPAIAEAMSERPGLDGREDLHARGLSGRPRPGRASRRSARSSSRPGPAVRAPGDPVRVRRLERAAVEPDHIRRGQALDRRSATIRDVEIEREGRPDARVARQGHGRREMMAEREAGQQQTEATTRSRRTVQLRPPDRPGLTTRAGSSRSGAQRRWRPRTNPSRPRPPGRLRPAIADPPKRDAAAPAAEHDGPVIVTSHENSGSIVCGHRYDSAPSLVPAPASFIRR